MTMAIKGRNRTASHYDWLRLHVNFLSSSLSSSSGLVGCWLVGQEAARTTPRPDDPIQLTLGCRMKHLDGVFWAARAATETSNWLVVSGIESLNY
jgi:hypothetical protein